MLNESETAPIGSTMTPKQIRTLKISIAIMTVLLIVGFILLIYGLFMRSGNKAEDNTARTTPAVTIVAPDVLNLPVEPGADIANALVEQGRLILHLRQPGSSEVAIIDLESGREVQRIKLAPGE